jgi:hypothetical protein
MLLAPDLVLALPDSEADFAPSLPSPFSFDPHSGQLPTSVPVAVLDPSLGGAQTGPEREEGRLFLGLDLSTQVRTERSVREALLNVRPFVRCFAFG